MFKSADMFLLRFWWNWFWSCCPCLSTVPGGLLAYGSKVSCLVAVATGLPLGGALLPWVHGVATDIARLLVGSWGPAKGVAKILLSVVSLLMDGVAGENLSLINSGVDSK